MAFADKFWELVTQAGSVVITSHKSPDDDAIASVLAMYWIVTNKFPEKKVEMVYTGEGSFEFFRQMANFDKIKFVPDFCDLADGYDLLILVDASRRDRCGIKTEKLA